MPLSASLARYLSVPYFLLPLSWTRFSSRSRYLSYIKNKAKMQARGTAIRPLQGTQFGNVGIVRD
jgi:hypothetical protein